MSERAVRIERPGSTSSIGFRVPLPVRRLRIGVAWEALAEVEIDAPQEPRVIELRTGVPPERRGVKIRPVGASMSLVGTARVVPDGSPARRSS